MPSTGLAGAPSQRQKVRENWLNPCINGLNPVPEFAKPVDIPVDILYLTKTIGLIVYSNEDFV